ncbi:hypothetical protein HNP81_002498 [Peribacillus huizhouensis]|uniref:Uncharacterized protein n=1 Tax=Peribacillus huizhouensis TaxID=1501239 RepID=A0ABR6CRD7_9BACI|nr:hypothetical protein [Peribacillus huizhouensis]
MRLRWRLISPELIGWCSENIGEAKKVNTAG